MRRMIQARGVGSIGAGRWWWWVLSIALLVLSDSSSWAQEPESGVSPTRVSLPDGPGSIEGIGANATTNLNMGLLTHAVEVTLPEGWAGLTPNLNLQYSSGSGQSPVGLGWSMSLPTIERMTSRGLPDYDTGDRFAANGGAELVPVGDGVYRARYESGFVRYRWIDAIGNDGAEGYWTAEYPDGRVGYFGADERGTLVPSARTTGPDGVYAWHLVALVDVYGHVARYEYQRDGSMPLLRRVVWAYSGVNTPVLSAELTWENRTTAAGLDVMSNARPGFDIRLTQRLAQIDVRAGRLLQRRYELDYDDSASTTRLVSVSRRGSDGRTDYGLRHTFAYTDEVYAGAPALVSMGTTGLAFADGSTDFVDLNGDALPDVVNTAGGVHTVWFNTLQLGAFPDDRVVGARFEGPQVLPSTSVDLANRGATLFDLDGNGLTDLIDTDNEVVLFNDGAGAWRSSALPVGLQFPDLTDPFRRLLDIDGDGRIDALRSDGDVNLVSLNRYVAPLPGNSGVGAGGFLGAQVLESALPLSLNDAGVQLADMNGDGLPDAVRRDGLSVAYRLNLGHGRWSGAIEMDGLTGSWSPNASWVDLTGDGLSDLVVVEANEVRWAPNLSGRWFGDVQRVSQASRLTGGAPLSLPERVAGVQVRFADMNGSGTTDIVWINASGRVDFLELTPIRPNLLARIQNGLGMTTEVEYGSSAHHLARDGGGDAWEYRVPNPTLTVDRMTYSEAYGGVRQQRTFYYHEGAYDGVERQFRGFATVDVLTAGDQSGEPGREVHTFDLGLLQSRIDPDTGATERRYAPEFHGRVRSVSTWSADRLLREVWSYWTRCPIAETAGAPGATPVVFVCQRRSEEVHHEESAPGVASGPAVTLRTNYTYDPYGNRIGEQQLGVVARGVGGCGACRFEAELYGAPCDRGARLCVGDERYTETTFVPPSAANGRWILNRPCVERQSAVQGSAGATERRTFYDGEPFSGLPACTLTTGTVSRVSERLDTAGATVDVERFRNNVHGRPVEQRDALGNARFFGWSDDGLQILSESLALSDPDTGAPYLLRMNVEYDPLYRTVQRATTWQREQADVPTASSAWIRFAYDVHGRLAGVWAADNTTGSPDTVYEYNNGAPVSTRRTIVFDAESRGRLHDRTECLDGMGRSVGEVVVVAPGLYRHINRQVYNVAGQSAWQWKPWTDASPACDVAPPPSVIRTTLTRDALQRLVRTEIDDSAEYGSPSVSRTVYAPLAQTEYDFSDMDSASPHADTPTTTLVDGLGRMTGVVERSRPTDARQHEFHYDERGGLAGWTTATGAQRRQLRDVRGQVVEVRDANHGTTRWQYDLLGNVAQVTEPTGEVITTVRDALSRPVTVLVDGTVRDEYRYDQVLGENGQRVYGEGRLSWAGYTLVNGVWSQEGVDRFVHDVRGQLAMVERTVDGVTHRLGMTYDNNGRVVQETVDGVAMPRVTLDAFGEFDGLAGVVTGVERDTHGNVNRLTYASGVVESMDFTTRNEVERTHVTGPEGAVLLSVSAQRDRMGNVLGIVDHSPLGPQARHDATFAYDGLSRMTAMTLSPSTTTRIAATYAYDGEGNLTRVQSGGVSVGPHEGTYVYDGVARQRLQRVNQPDGEVVWRSYDEAGRVLVEGERQFEWLAGGRLGLARRGEFEVGFDYDAGGEQVYWRDTALGSGVQLAPHIAVRDGLVQYTVEAGRPIAELTFASSAVRDRCAYGGAGLAGARQAYLALSAPDRAARGRLADCLRQAAAEASLETGSISWTGVHVGVLSGVPLLTDEQGRAVTERVHTPHGFELANAGVREQFMGIEGARVHDASLHSLGVRTYSVDTAQWLSPDPLTAVVEADATNLWETLFYPYRYANQNPATLSDESGELPFIVVGAAVGAVIAGGLELGKQMASGKELRWGDIGQKAFWGGVGGVLGGLGATTYAGVILGQVGGAIAEEAAEMLIPEAGCPPGVSACFVAKSVIGAAGGALGSGLGDLASAAASSAGRAGLAMLAALPAETGVRALASFGADVAKGTVEDLVKKSVLEPVGNAIGRAAAQAASTAYSAAESGYQRLEQSIQQTVTAPNIYMSPGAGVLP